MTDYADRAGTAAAALFVVGVVLLPIMQLRVGLGSSDLIPADIAFVLSGGLALIAMMFGGIPIRRTLFVGGCLAYVAASLIVLFADGVTRATVTGAATAVYVAGLAVLAHHLIPSRVSSTRFLKAFVAGTAIAVTVAVAGIVLFYVGFDDYHDNRLLGEYGNVASGPYPRIVGSFISPNLLCNYLICGLIAVLIARHLRVISGRPATVLLAAVVVVIGFTLSPGIGGALLAGGVWMWAYPQAIRSAARRRGALLAGIGGAVVFLGLTLVVLEFDHGLHQSLRVRAWRDAGHRFLDRPLLGNGLDENLGHVPLGGKSRPLLTDAHSLWLSIAGQMGILGIGAIVAAFAATFVSAERRRRLWRDPIARGLAIALLGALAYQGLSMSAEDTRHLWIVLGALAGLAYGEREIVVS